MKDPHVGAMGVAAGALLLLGKFALLLSVAGTGPADSLNMPALLALVPILSRMFLPWAIVAWPYAGGERGMAAGLRAVRPSHAWASALVGACCAALLLALAGLLGSGDPVMLLPLVALGAAITAGGGALGAWRMSRSFGGLTGDSYGALVEGLELVLLLGLALLIGAA